MLLTLGASTHVVDLLPSKHGHRRSEHRLEILWKNEFPKVGTSRASLPFLAAHIYIIVVLSNFYTWPILQLSRRSGPTGTHGNSVLHDRKASSPGLSAASEDELRGVGMTRHEIHLLRAVLELQDFRERQ